MITGRFGFANPNLGVRLNIADSLSMPGRARMGGACEVKQAELAMDVKPIGTKCIRCDGQTNLLISGWTPESPTEETSWTCPRCLAANTIMVAGNFVGVAIGTGRVVSGTRPPLEY